MRIGRASTFAAAVIAATLAACDEAAPPQGAPAVGPSGVPSTGTSTETTAGMTGAPASAGAGAAATTTTPATGSTPRPGGGTSDAGTSGGGTGGSGAPAALPAPSSSLAAPHLAIPRFVDTDLGPRVEIHWSRIAAAKEYRVEISRDRDFTALVRDFAIPQWWIRVRLRPGAYFVRVQATADGATGAASAPRRFIVPETEETQEDTVADATTSDGAAVAQNAEVEAAASEPRQEPSEPRQEPSEPRARPLPKRRMSTSTVSERKSGRGRGHDRASFGVRPNDEDATSDVDADADAPEAGGADDGGTAAGSADDGGTDDRSADRASADGGRAGGLSALPLSADSLRALEARIADQERTLAELRETRQTLESSLADVEGVIPVLPTQSRADAGALATTIRDELASARSTEEDLAAEMQRTANEVRQLRDDTIAREQQRPHGKSRARTRAPSQL